MLDPEMPNEPGKCYYRCSVADEVEITEKKYLEFQGDFYNQDFIDVVEHTLEPKTEEWVKKPSNRVGFKGATKDDMFVWCLVETESVIKTVYHVRDTSQTKLFKPIVLTEKLFIKKNEPVWKEVVCEKDQTIELYLEIHSKLALLGYESEKPTIDKKPLSLMNALRRYQKHNLFAYGGFSVESLDHLGVKY